jgi:hypothetical protein
MMIEFGFTTPCLIIIFFNLIREVKFLRYTSRLDETAKRLPWRPFHRAVLEEWKSGDLIPRYPEYPNPVWSE